MLELKLFVQSDNWFIRIRFVNFQDRSLLCFINLITCGRYDDLFSFYPVNCFSQSYLSCIRLNGGIQGGPSRWSLNSMHIECSISNSDDLVAIYWDVWAGYVTVHCDCNPGSVWICLCSDLHSSILDKDVRCIKGSMMIWISMWLEYHLSFNNNSVQLRTILNIDQQI